MHAITPIALAGLLLGAGCAALFGYCAYGFARVSLRMPRSKRRKG